MAPRSPIRNRRARSAAASSHPTTAVVAVGRGRRASLMRRAQQWLSARERLLSDWFAHAQRTARSARASVQARVQTRRAKRLGGAGAIIAPAWWEYESELKRRIALEALMRRLFSLAPPAAA